jgi:glycosyltransferase involved in cell wall biosynthesis
VARLCYGIDFDTFAGPAEARWAAGYEWPRRFLFAGRYVPIKGIDMLVAAYRIYRGAVADPWPLTTCGSGPLKHLLEGVPGVTDRGFVQPVGLPAVFAEAGVFVLPSRLDPWGQVIVEAAASGLPVVCTQACGAAAENVRDYHNGLLVPAVDPGALAQAMIWMHEHYDALPRMGRESQHLAAAYSAQRWADNQTGLAARLLASPAPR